MLINPGGHPGAEAEKDRLSAVMCSHALKLVEELRAKAVIVNGDVALSTAPLRQLLKRDDVFIITKDGNTFPRNPISTAPKSSRSRSGV